jgi:DNA-directed RNA polymerase subunit RPC12/RpoP
MNMLKFSCFLCENCKTEIQASSDMIGQETECPACGAKLVIPDAVDDGIGRHGPEDDDPDTVQALKSRTIRIELGDF